MPSSSDVGPLSVVWERRRAKLRQQILKRWGSDNHWYMIDQAVHGPYGGLQDALDALNADPRIQYPEDDQSETAPATRIPPTT